MRLHLNCFGEETGVPLLIVHGLFGSARNWHSLARRFAQDRWVVSLDLRNHGESPWADTHSYADLAQDLQDTIQDLGTKADVLGHSMGGKAAMLLALQNPQSVNSLIVADIAPVDYQHSQTQHIDHMASLPLGNLTRRAEAQKELTAKTGDTALGAFFSQSLNFDVSPPEWRLNLKALKASMPEIMSFPFIEGMYAGKTLALNGGASDYVTRQGLEKMGQLFQNHETATIPAAGHWLHAEKPKEFVSIVNEFLN